MHRAGQCQSYRRPTPGSFGYLITRAANTIRCIGKRTVRSWFDRLTMSGLYRCVWIIEWPYASRVPACNCVAKGRKSRFPAHFLSFPLVPVGHRAGRGAEWGSRAGFWRRFWWYWRAGERVWGREVPGVGSGPWDGCRGPGWRVGFGRWVIWYGWGKGWSKEEVSPGRGVSELGFFWGIG